MRSPFSYYKRGDKTSSNPLDLVTNGAVQLENAALLLSKISILGDFQPSSLWDGVEKVWKKPRFKPKETNIDELKYVFRKLIRNRIKGNHNIAVSFSGGLDSLAILKTVTSLLDKPRLQCTAITADLTDDTGNSAATRARNIINQLSIPCQHVVVKPDGASQAPSWNPRGPRLEAMPRIARAISDHASKHNASVLFLGDGADETLRSPRYLVWRLLRDLDFSTLKSYITDIASRGVYSVRDEFLCSLGYLSPHNISSKLYWAINWPDLCHLGNHKYLNKRYRQRVNEWSSQWLTNHLSNNLPNEGSWCDFDALDALYPSDPFPDAGNIPTYSPFLEDRFVEKASSIPLTERYNSNYTSRYRRVKSLVIDLIDVNDHSYLPDYKCIYSKSFKRSISNNIDQIDVLYDYSLIRDDLSTKDVYPSLLLRMIVLSRWLKEAYNKGFDIKA